MQRNLTVGGVPIDIINTLILDNDGPAPMRMIWSDLTGKEIKSEILESGHRALVQPDNCKLIYFRVDNAVTGANFYQLPAPIAGHPEGRVFQHSLWAY